MQELRAEGIRHPRRRALRIDHEIKNNKAQAQGQEKRAPGCEMTAPVSSAGCRVRRPGSNHDSTRKQCGLSSQAAGLQSRFTLAETSGPGSSSRSILKGRMQAGCLGRGSAHGCRQPALPRYGFHSSRAKPKPHCIHVHTETCSGQEVNTF